VSKGKTEEAERVIQQAARVNRISGFPSYVFKSRSMESVDKEFKIKIKTGNKHSKTKIATVDENYETNMKFQYENLAVNMDVNYESLETKTAPDYLLSNMKVIKVDEGLESKTAPGSLLSNMKVIQVGDVPSQEGSILPPQVVEEEEECDSLAVYSMLDVLKHPRLRRFLIVASIIWYVLLVVLSGM